jgi:hypothetical protein
MHSYRKNIIFSFGICNEIRIIATEFPIQFHLFIDPFLNFVFTQSKRNS